MVIEIAGTVGLLEKFSFHGMSLFIYDVFRPYQSEYMVDGIAATPNLHLIAYTCRYPFLFIYYDLLNIPFGASNYGCTMKILNVCQNIQQHVMLGK